MFARASTFQICVAWPRVTILFPSNFKRLHVRAAPAQAVNMLQTPPDQIMRSAPTGEQPSPCQQTPADQQLPLKVIPEAEASDQTTPYETPPMQRSNSLDSAMHQLLDSQDPTTNEDASPDEDVDSQERGRRRERQILRRPERCHRVASQRKHDETVKDRHAR